jgi:hypothetical protein
MKDALCEKFAPLCGGTGLLLAGGRHLEVPDDQ